MIPGAPELVALDTNVILRAVLADDATQSPAAQNLLASLSPRRRGFITTITMAEIVWVLSRRPDFSRTAALGVVRRLIEAEVLEFDDAEGVVRALNLAEDGADFADALISGAGQQFGVTETVTFDRRAADRLGWRLLE
ncbi:PIN domain-containing protein [Microbacterium sp. GXF0217]